MDLMDLQIGGVSKLSVTKQEPEPSVAATCELTEAQKRAFGDYQPGSEPMPRFNPGPDLFGAMLKRIATRLGVEPLPKGTFRPLVYGAGDGTRFDAEELFNALMDKIEKATP